MIFRTEYDSLGPMQIEEKNLWGPQTQRSLQNFPIGTEKMPPELLRALVEIKRAAAQANAELQRLDSTRAKLIQQVCDEILEGQWADQFPLSLWQTGSGTQTNMNVNEVIAHRGNQLAITPHFLHPNDHVNCSQSSNDTFPTAMHLAALHLLQDKLFPSLEKWIEALLQLEKRYPDQIKVGRTHLQDAVPMRFAQEVSGWRSMFEHNLQQIRTSLPEFYALALGGTAVGTGLNAPAGFAERVTEILAARLKLPLFSSENKMRALASKDEFAFAHGALRTLAVNLCKVANDLRWLASGPRCGLAEIQLPENEPGSSIMPGKVNPTQCESATLVAARVFGNDTTIQFAASQGNFELNVYMPVLIDAFLQSARLLADSLTSLRLRCLEGLQILPRMRENVEQSLMLATALNPILGYEKAAQIARRAYLQNTSLKTAAVALGYLTEEEFDAQVRPEDMV